MADFIPTPTIPRKVHRKILSKKDCGIHWLLSSNALYFALAASTKEIETDIVLIWLDNLAQPRSQLSILRVCNRAFKHTKLHPLTIGFEDFVDFSPASIF